MGKQYGSSGRPSKQFNNGSNTHHGGSLSQSGYGRYNTKPKPPRGNGGGGGGQTFGQAFLGAFGGGPSSTSHGGSKKKRNKGKGSR